MNNDKGKGKAPGAEPPIAAANPYLRVITLFLGVGFLVFVVYLISVLFRNYSSSFYPEHWVAFYVGVALVTGMSFWLFTGSSGQITLKEVGGKLGGGAAIGMIFMVMAQKLTPNPPPNASVFDLPVMGSIGGNAISWNDRIDKVTHLEPNGYRCLVEFNEGENHGEIYINYLNRSGQLTLRAYRVSRTGEISKRQDQIIEGIP